MWEKTMNASHCYEESAVRTAVPDMFNRVDNSDNCPTKEDLNMYGDHSAHVTCILESMGFLGEKGGVRNGKIRRNVAQLNPRVLENYKGSMEQYGYNMTDNDPSGYKTCMDNSFLMNMVPDIIDSCKDTYPKNHRYRREIKQFWNRWAAYVCFQSVSEACKQVLIEDISYVAMSGSAPETEYATTEDVPIR
jgi:hypothetical protein